jgi:mevalonate kinase
VQIVCTKGGKLGFIGEHSMMDGMPAVGLCSHILNTTYADVINRNAPPLYTSDSQDESGVKSIFKNVMPLLKTAEGRNVVDAVVKGKKKRYERCIYSFI